MKTKGLFTLLTLALLSINSIAQETEKRFGVELNSEVSIVSSDLNGANLNTGLGFETIFQYRFMPFTSVYGGWGYTHFNANESFAGTDIDFEQTGYILGLQLKNSIGESPLSYFVRGGLLYSHIETENNDGDIISDTGHGVGFQVAGGLEVALGKNWSLAPSLKYNSLSGETELEGVNHKLELRYVSARLGIVKRF
jgi:opacity protein-like surface antigen